MSNKSPRETPPKGKQRDKIFCIETEFFEKDLKSTATAEGILRYMADYQQFEYIYKKVPTIDAMYFYLNKVLTAKYKTFTIIYLPTHASPGSISINNQETIDLSEFAQKYKGRFLGRIIHFGGCSFMNKSTEELSNFKKALGAKIVTGYTKDVTALEAIAFEMLLFDSLQKYKSKLINIRNRMYKEQPFLAKKLGFEVI